MKKIILLASTVLLSVGAWANSEFKAVSTCQFDYDDVNFCSKQNIATYKKNLASKKANFDEKYILLNIGTRKEMRFVAINSKNGVVFPLNDAILGFKDNRGGLNGKPPILNYSLQGDDFCITGSVSSYRNAYDNVYICFSIQNDDYSKYGKSFERNGFPKEI